MHTTCSQWSLPATDGTAAASDETLSADDDFGLGKTTAKPQPITATPVPAEVGRKTAPGRRGVMDDDDPPSVKTEEFTPAPGRPRTEQMPAMKRSSRKLEPLPVSEPSVVVRPSVAISVSATERATAPDHSAIPEQAPPKSKGPLFAVLGSLVLGLLVGVGWVSTHPETAPVTTPQIEPPITAATVPEVVSEKEPVVAPPPVAVAEVDAGLASPELEPIRPIVAEKAPPQLPVVRKMGTLSVKAVPFATVLIQGKSYEVTGVQKVPAPAGTYEITLIHPKRKVKEKVTVQANQTTSVSFSAD